MAESGYRYYGGAEVDRLQDILYYRALGVELARIKECLDDPSFDPVSYTHLSTAMSSGSGGITAAAEWPPSPPNRAAMWPVCCGS